MAKKIMFESKVCVSALLCGAVFVAVLSLDGAAQTARRKRQKEVPPRVGKIKNYPATGLMTGCGNFYSHFAHEDKLPDPGLVFISSGDGTNTWMNLDGRDVRLKLIKSPKGKRPFRSHYRWGKVLIVALFEDFKPEGQPYEEGDHMTKVKITLRRGRSVRTVRLVGDSDC